MYSFPSTILYRFYKIINDNITIMSFYVYRVEFNRSRRISQKLREIQEKVLYENCWFSWGKKILNNIQEILALLLIRHLT